MCQTDGLSTVLRACYLCNNLRCNVTSGTEGMRLLNQRTGYHSTILKHVLQVYEATVVRVLDEVV